MNVPYQYLGLSETFSFIFFFQYQFSYVCNYVFLRDTTLFLFSLFLLPIFKSAFTYVCIFWFIQFSHSLILLIFIFFCCFYSILISIIILYCFIYFYFLLYFITYSVLSIIFFMESSLFWPHKSLWEHIQKKNDS